MISVYRIDLEWRREEMRRYYEGTRQHWKALEERTSPEGKQEAAKILQAIKDAH